MITFKSLSSSAQLALYTQSMVGLHCDSAHYEVAVGVDIALCVFTKTYSFVWCKWISMLPAKYFKITKSGIFMKAL